MTQAVASKAAAVHTKAQHFDKLCIGIGVETFHIYTLHACHGMDA